MADYLARAAQTAAQLSRRLSETVTETTRELAFDTGSRYLETAEDRLQDVKHLLESRYDREQLEGLKRLVAVSKLQVQHTIRGRGIIQYTNL
jgi:AP-3 complex subunit beta